MPFTSPSLIGARARSAPRVGIEFVIPNPSGAHGVYVVPWAGVRGLCRPTVHDERLMQVVASLPALTPGTVRAAARRVALEGLAGQEAEAAARSAEAAARRAWAVTETALQMALLRQVAPAAGGAKDADAIAAVIIKAAGGGQTVDAVARALSTLTTLYAGIGLAPDATGPGPAQVRTQVSNLATTLRAWADRHADSAGNIALAVADSADTILQAADALLAAARARTDDMAGLIRATIAAPETIARLLTRADWLLDGWHLLPAMWERVKDDPARQVVLSEILHTLPVLPSEALAWTPIATEPDTVRWMRRSGRKFAAERAAAMDRTANAARLGARAH